MQVPKSPKINVKGNKTYIRVPVVDEKLRIKRMNCFRKYNLKPQTFLFTAVCLLLLMPLKIYPQEGAQLFKTHCAVCHTVGKGRLVGPDLENITADKTVDWLSRFIKSSKKMIDSGDPDAKAIAGEYFNILMPDFAGSDPELKAIIQYLGNGSESLPEEEKLPQIIVGNADTGRMYFEGKLHFQNKGASCLSCHHVSYPNALEGGLLAKDLTRSFKTLGGVAGVKAIISAPPFHSMQITYKNSKLTEKEIAHLAAYLEIASGQEQLAGANMMPDTFLIGIIMTVFLVILIGLLWAGRKKESVNKTIYKRQFRQ